MKASIHNKWLLLVGLFLYSSFSFAVQQEKVVKKSYKVTPSTLIDIDNKFGKVHINTWDKNEVNVLIEIEVDSRNPENVFEKIDIEFDDRIGDNYLGIKTVLEDIRGKSSFSINYTIDMPAKNNLKLSNKFGDTFIEDLSGKVELHLGYGSLKAGNLTGDADIFLEFGSGMSQIESLKSCNLTIKYSKITVERSGNMEIISQFSEVIGEEFSTVDLDMKYGKFVAENLNFLEGELQFSDLRINELSGDLALDLKHTQLTVEGVNLSVSKIWIDGQFSKMNITLPSDMNMNLDLNFKFADLKYKGEKIKFNKIIKENTSKEYEGYIGRENSGKTLTVDSKYGDLSLDVL